MRTPCESCNRSSQSSAAFGKMLTGFASISFPPAISKRRFSTSQPANVSPPTEGESPRRKLLSTLIQEAKNQTKRRISSSQNHGTGLPSNATFLSKIRSPCSTEEPLPNANLERDPESQARPSLSQWPVHGCGESGVERLRREPSRQSQKAESTPRTVKSSPPKKPTVKPISPQRTDSAFTPADGQFQLADHLRPPRRNFRRER